MLELPQWNAALPAELPQQEIHVWRSALELPPESSQRLESLLSPEERARADRFVFARDRLRFTAGRGLLRLLLGFYTGNSPEKIEFAYSDRGKPSLLKNPGGLQFNVSHSHGTALFAFARNSVLGIDLEMMRPEIEMEEIAQRFFAPDEVRALLQLEKKDRLAGFFNCWTRKEAYLKAKGDGLNFRLDAFVVSLDSEATLIRDDADPEASTRWQLVNLPPCPGYCGALVYSGPPREIRLAEWNGEIPV